MSAADVIEKARNWRALDPLEKTTDQARPWRREKARELGGNWRTGLNGTASERLASVAAKLDADADGGGGGGETSARGGGASVGSPPGKRAEKAQWLCGDFDTKTKKADPILTDAALLASHRQPYVDAATREKQVYRQRDKGKEMSAPRSEMLPSKTVEGDPRAAGERARRAAAMARDEPPPRMVDDLEMQTAYALSTGLTIYRKAAAARFDCVVRIMERVAIVFDVCLQRHAISSPTHAQRAPAASRDGRWRERAVDRRRCVARVQREVLWEGARLTSASAVVVRRAIEGSEVVGREHRPRKW